MQSKDRLNRNIQLLQKMDISLSDKLDRILKPKLFSDFTPGLIQTRPSVSSSQTQANRPKEFIARMKRNQESRRLSPPKNGTAPEAPALLNRQGQTPLQNACLYGEMQIIKSLLEDGVDVNHEDWLGNTALMYAVRANQSAVVELLLSSSDVDVCKKYGVRII